MVLFSFFFLRFFILLDCIFFFCDSGFFLFCFLNKTLALKDSQHNTNNGYQPPPLGPSGLGVWGPLACLWLCSWCGHGGQGEALGGGVCTAAPWGDVTRKGTWTGND